MNLDPSRREEVTEGRNQLSCELVQTVVADKEFISQPLSAFFEKIPQNLTNQSAVIQGQEEVQRSEVSED